MNEIYGNIYNIEKFHIHDGSGIRTNVFLKGCNLACPWCSNPESQQEQQQLVLYPNLCVSCLACEKACPANAIYHIDKKVLLNRERCNFCGKCVTICPRSARQIFGKSMSVSEVMVEVRKDAAFYTRSGGGVTISGGEPLLQIDFIRQLSLECRQELIDVAVETAGLIETESVMKALEYCNEVLLDIKTLEAEKFNTLFGRFTDGHYWLNLLVDNVKALRLSGKEVIFRCPIIPKFNDDKKHISKVCELAGQYGIKRIDLLPFHQFGKHKYAALSREYQYEDLKPLEHSDLSPYKLIIEENGFECKLGG
jgi:pyruvate formate lyase activating enzyme